MFRDKARGEVRELSDMGTAEVESLVFQMATSVTQLKRLVDGLGTTKDTVEFRGRITEQNARVQGLAKSIKERVTALGADRASMSEQQAAKARKLMQDFAAILQDYKATQKVAADREAATLPRTPPPPPPRASPSGSGSGAGAAGDVEEGLATQALLQQQQQREVRQLDNAIEYNESLIEERDHGIAEIQRQIGEVNEMFQDLAVLIHDQGSQLQTVDVHIASAAERAREGTQQLVKAERSQRATRNKCLVVWLAAGVAVAVILVLLFA